MPSFPKNHVSVPAHVEQIKTLFEGRLHKPCYIAGNGPSSKEVFLSPEEAEEGTVFRANWFFLEEEKRMGARVDGFFWSVENKGLREALQEIQATNNYTVKAFFQPFYSSDAKDKMVNANASSLLPNYDHWAVISTNPTLGRFLMGRPLPTQGMQMIAFAAIIGFKKIFVSGIDLYSEAASRYAWNVPDAVKSHLKEKDLSPGYESNHDLEVDLMFLRAIRSEYDFELIGLSDMKIMSPYLDSHERKHSVLPKHPTKVGGDKIYVTLADSRYVIGAMALARSLSKVSEVPLLVIHSDPYAPRALAHLPNVITKRVEKLKNHHNPSQSRFMDTFTKLRIFDLLEYKRIVFIDADCIVLKNIDDLFESDDFLAAPDWGINITDDFNSGLLAFNPSQELQLRVYSSLYSHESSDGGDQGFLNSLFGGEVKRLPPEYNVLKRLPVHHPNLINMDEAKVIHFVGEKPWDIHQKQQDFIFLETIWSTFMEKKDWQHEFWMNKTFVSKRWGANTKVKKSSKAPPSQTLSKFEQQKRSYGPLRRTIVEWGDKLLPPKAGAKINKLLKQFRVL